MSSVVLDTRTPYKNEQAPHLSTSPPESQVGSASLVTFRLLVKQLLRANHHDRTALRQKVADRLRDSLDQSAYLDELLDQCVTKGGPDGLDIAIDVLSNFGRLVLDAAREFWARDVERWNEMKESFRYHLHDDHWYVLLRALAMSSLEVGPKLGMILLCTEKAPPRIREAGVHALGDVGGTDAIRFLSRIAVNDPSPMVRESAAEVLHDLEG